jgi:hypothetical protein
MLKLLMKEDMSYSGVLNVEKYRMTTVRKQLNITNITYIILPKEVNEQK